MVNANRTHRDVESSVGGRVRCDTKMRLRFCEREVATRKLLYNYDNQYTLRIITTIS